MRDILEPRKIVAKNYAGSKWDSYPGQYITYTIAGFEHRPSEVQRAFEQKSSGTVLLLMKERSNPFDKEAVAVYSALTIDTPSYQWTKVGYLPRDVANGEFRDVPNNLILEAKKYGPRSLQLVGKLRSYVD